MSIYSRGCLFSSFLFRAFILCMVGEQVGGDAFALVLFFSSIVLCTRRGRLVFRSLNDRRKLACDTMQSVLRSSGKCV